ncbi:MAG TPA: ATP-binding protein [Candidatus Dormibacteraeota bacterium]|nr:ATP-binding protein [Candidatus Dormibacteraeota bacterium]
MDGVVIAFIAIQAVALAVALGIAWSRGRTIEELDEALHEAEAAGGGAVGTSPADDDLADRLRRLRRRAEGAEFALEQRLRDLGYLADLVGVGIVRLSDELGVEIANTAAHVFLRREPGSMIGRTAIEALGDHRIEAIARGAREAGWSSGEVTLAEMADSAGTTLVVRARRSPILGVWLVFEDVAELRRLQRIRAEFIDNLSHELRTPITTIGLLVESLGRDADGAQAAGAPVPAKMRERIGKLEVETGNIAQMVAELLDLARIESGGRQLHLDDVDLGRIATDSTERLRPFAERQGVTLVAEVPRGLPPVRGEAARLAQVFANLIHNAVKFSPSGTEVRVGVAREPEAIRPTVARPRSAAREMLVATVRDEGPGISPVDQARIFERFYKADRTRTAGGGTGLGLAIARHIVEGHGGVIQVESEEGSGALFRFTIPVSDAPAAVGRSAPARAAGG